jgi:oxygen-independent coproporphyrinogen-3 oxidase
LIAGFNGQTKEMWLHSVEQLTKLAPQTISIYCVRIRPDSQFGRSGKYNNSYDFYYDWYEDAREVMLNAGYVQETNVRFKIPEKGGYIQQYYQFICKPILGVGAGARSYTSVADYIVGGSAKPNVHEIEEYMDKVEAGAPLLRSLYELDDEERARRKLVLNLYEFNERQFQDEFGSRFNWIYKEKFAFLMNEGLLDRDGDLYFLTKQGIEYRDIISWSFFSERVRELDKQFYSELVAVK